MGSVSRRKDGRNVTVANALDLWLAAMKGQVEPTTWARYEAQVRLYVRPALGHIKLSELYPITIAQWYARMEAEGVSDSNRAKSARLLRQFLSRSVQMGMIALNPSFRLPLPKSRPKRPVLWTTAQLAQFLAANQGRPWYGLFLLALDSGMRLSELLALEWTDIDLDNRTVSVTKTLTERDGRIEVKPPKTRAGRRLVVISTECQAVLQARREAYPSVRLVFGNEEDRYKCRHDVYAKVWIPAVERAGVPSLRFHDLRHMTATYLLAAGTPVKTVQERLGHSKIQTTLDTYGHAIPNRHAQAAGHMAGFLASILPSDSVRNP
jgi:integrase